MIKTLLIPTLMAPMLLTAFIFTSQSSLAGNIEQANKSQENDKRRGPPPAAFNACKGKTSGDSTQFETRRGKIISGTCEVLGGENSGKLVLRPDKMKMNEKKNAKRRMPPEAAFIACEGKNVGETSQFESRFGKILTGTCEDSNGKLVLRPKR